MGGASKNLAGDHREAALSWNVNWNSGQGSLTDQTGARSRGDNYETGIGLIGPAASRGESSRPSSERPAWSSDISPQTTRSVDRDAIFAGLDRDPMLIGVGKFEAKEDAVLVRRTPAIVFPSPSRLAAAGTFLEV